MMFIVLIILYRSYKRQNDRHKEKPISHSKDNDTDPKLKEYDKNI